MVGAGRPPMVRKTTDGPGTQVEKPEKVSARGRLLAGGSGSTAGGDEGNDVFFNYIVRCRWACYDAAPRSHRCDPVQPKV